MQDWLPLPQRQGHHRQGLAIQTLRTCVTHCCRDQYLYCLDHNAVGQGTAHEVGERRSWLKKMTQGWHTDGEVVARAAQVLQHGQ
jgi:hypothetical protein